MLAQRGYALAALGRLREAAQTAEEAERLAREHQDLESEVYVWTFKSYLAVVAGDLEAARHGAQRLLEMAERLGTALWRAMGFSRLASALVECGEFDQALAAAARAAAITHAEAPASFIQAEIVAARARALLGAGDAAQARVAAQEALDLCEHWAQIPKSQMIAVAAAAHVLLRTEGPTSPVASRALEWWAQLVEQLHNWADRPRLHCEWAERARLLGDEAAYLRELHEAHRLFVEIGATGHAERISRQLAAVSAQPEER